MNINVGWRLRNAFTWSPPLWGKPITGTIERVRERLSSHQTVRFEVLGARYDLRQWETVLSVDEYIENLYVLDVCDHYVGAPPTAGRGLDIGTRNGVYLLALHAFVPLPWLGIELDGYRRYWNLCTRQAYANHALRIRPACRYHVGSLNEVEDRFSLVTWFLPFVSEETLKPYGLPGRYFQPDGLLKHAYALLQPGGRLFIVNQGRVEQDAQRKLFAKHGITAADAGEIDSVFSPFKKKRFGWLVEKTL